MADDHVYGEPEQLTTQNFTADSTQKVNKTTNNKQQTTNNKQQTTNNKQQTTNNKQTI